MMVVVGEDEDWDGLDEDDAATAPAAAAADDDDDDVVSFLCLDNGELKILLN